MTFPTRIALSTFFGVSTLVCLWLVVGVCYQEDLSHMTFAFAGVNCFRLMLY